MAEPNEDYTERDLIVWCQNRIRELEAENAALREALGAADEALMFVLKYADPDGSVAKKLTEARALIEAALKGV